MRLNKAVMPLLVGALLLAAAPASGQDEGSPAPKVSPVPLPTEPSRRDLYLDMPYYIGGFEPAIVMTRGEEHFANLTAGDETRQGLEGLLDDVGAEVGDMASGYALVSQEGFFGFVVGIRIDGVEPGTLLPAYLPILLEDLEDPQAATRTLGGKDVTVITSVGEDAEYVELYVYDEGDTIWMVQGPPSVSETTLSNLPEPLTSE